jgi:NitT/TauT family transport system ATP-binding protein
VEVDRISFAYGGNLVLREVSFSVPPGQFVSIIGPSGCGKSTLLLLIAGMISPGRGELRVAGKPVTGPGDERAMVFQSFALLPWKSLEDNVGLGLRYRRQDLSRAERRERVHHYIEMVGLSGYEGHYPHQLSGGMQQRVGLARAFAVEAPILLMDEPFGAVDAQTRRQLQEELTRLHEMTPKMVLFVTHSMSEAVRLGDRIVLLTPRPGQVREIVQVPLQRPRSPDLETDPNYAELKEYLWHQLRDRGTRSAPEVP